MTRSRLYRMRAQAHLCRLYVFGERRDLRDPVDKIHVSDRANWLSWSMWEML